MVLDQRERREEELRELANKARMERGGGGGTVTTAPIQQGMPSAEESHQGTSARVQHDDENDDDSVESVTQRGSSNNDQQSQSNNNNEEDGDNKYSGDTSTIASLRHEGIKDFSLQLLTHIQTSTYINITTLDVSHNELSDLPGIASLSNLEVLCIKRNWFNTLPTDIGKLHKLKKIDASRNFMKPNIDSLRLNELKNLSQLHVLDVTLNQKCRTADHRKYIKQYLQPLDVEVLVTVWQEASNGEHSCIGASAAQRDATI